MQFNDDKNCELKAKTTFIFLRCLFENVFIAWAPAFKLSQVYSIWGQGLAEKYAPAGASAIKKFYSGN